MYEIKAVSPDNQVEDQEIAEDFEALVGLLREFDDMYSPFEYDIVVRALL